jgi:hypothetical protein
VHQILGNDLNMNRVCARWIPRILTAEHLTKRVELSKQFIKKGINIFFPNDLVIFALMEESYSFSTDLTVV